MNIYAIEDHKVKVTEESANNGYELDVEKVKKHLETGKEYTVLYTVIEDYHTIVKLKEFPREFFNAVNFEDVSYQSLEEDKLHQDWTYYQRRNSHGC